MKMFENYINERLGQQLFLLPGVAFATYKIHGEECYIVEIHVEEEHRRKHIAFDIGNEITKIAKAHGCKLLLGSVNLNANGATISHKGMLAFGFEPHTANDNFIMYRKAI